VWFKPPGWRPGDVAAKWPKPDFNIHHVERFDPLMTRGEQVLAGIVFVALLGTTTAFLWNAHRLSLLGQAGCAIAIVATLWLVGFVSERSVGQSGVRCPSTQA
jgi:hypothetical protein